MEAVCPRFGAFQYFDAFYLVVVFFGVGLVLDFCHLGLQ
jgi:hypothetical protein